MGKLNYGATGLSYEVKKSGVTQSGAPKCPRCQDRVYFNEEKKAQGKSYHKRCFTCSQCKKGLDSTNYNEHEADLYCTACHRKQFGPKGYGFAGGAAGLSTAPPPPSTPSSLSTSAEALFARDNPNAQSNGGAPANGTPATVDPDDPERCPRCTKRVYFAEEVKVQRRKYHKLCFKCRSCNKLLEPSKFNVHDNCLYCQACYGRSFGPKGYGFSGGCGSMLAAETQPRPFSNRTNTHTTYTESVTDPRMAPAQAHQAPAMGPLPASTEWTEPVDL